MIYTVGMDNHPIRIVSPDVGDVLSVVLPNGHIRYFKALPGNVGRCTEYCPMARMKVLSPSKSCKWNICGYANFACRSGERGYYWEEVPIESIMEELI